MYGTKQHLADMYYTITVCVHQIVVELRITLYTISLIIQPGLTLIENVFLTLIRICLRHFYSDNTHRCDRSDLKAN